MDEKIKIVEVTSKSLLRKFVDYPNKLYADVPEFVPAFYGDDLADWNKKKNPAFKYCEAKAFLAYRDDQIVGRIGAILSHEANRKWHTNRMRFSQVDFIDDRAVSEALFVAVESWAKEKGCDQVHGPLGFCDMDREGMLVDGFDKRSMFITYYNHPYYNEHLRALGYIKDTDWVEYKIPVPKEDDRYYVMIHRAAERILKNSNYRKVHLTSKTQYKPYIEKFFRLVNQCYAHLYGVVELNEDQIRKYANKFIPLINPDYITLVVDEHDDLVAFGACAPSVAAAMQKSRGRLFPTGWIGVLKAFNKNNALDMFLTAVRPDLQNTGLNAVVIDHIMVNANKNGIEYAETGPQLETNTKVLSQWKQLNLTPHKRRRCYIKDI